MARLGGVAGLFAGFLCEPIATSKLHQLHSLDFVHRLVPSKFGSIRLMPGNCRLTVLDPRTWGVENWSRHSAIITSVVELSLCPAPLRLKIGCRTAGGRLGSLVLVMPSEKHVGGAA